MNYLECGECHQQFQDSTAVETSRAYNDECGQGCLHLLDVHEEKEELVW